MEQAPVPRTRLAPTPSGLLHAGNAVNFLLTQRLARHFGAALSLRIDDLDAERVRPEYVEDIFDSLAWLGITWDDGPGSAFGLADRWSQSLRIPRYNELLDRLRRSGHLYACGCTRKRSRSTATDGRYPGTCRERGLSLDAPDVAWRLRVAHDTRVLVPALFGPGIQVDLQQAMGDPVLRQRNGRPAYQIASLSDDLDMGTTFIVRGVDLLPSTACQLHVARLLGYDRFLAVRFVHHALLLDDHGAKLSKSAGAGSLLAMRQQGLSIEVLERQADALYTGLLGAS